MQASGTFEIDLRPQEDPEYPAGRMTISKAYVGDMTGTGIGQMISKRTENGVAVYFAVEEFTGSVQGIQGSFTLIHKGQMSPGSQSLEVVILAGSGSEGLSAICGAMQITQGAAGHAYELTFEC